MVERSQADANFGEGLYWGDTHLHTGYSTDSGMIGNKLTPEDAYRFALGETVTTSTGERHERIYDVAVSDGRTIGSDGRCTTPVGNTVDVANASYLNNIGDAQLRTVWTDPDFDPDHRAVYYARVLEIPTPTWQAFDSNFFGITMPDDVPLSHQDRGPTPARSGTRRRSNAD